LSYRYLHNCLGKHKKEEKTFYFLWSKLTEADIFAGGMGGGTPAAGLDGDEDESEDEMPSLMENNRADILARQMETSIEDFVIGQ